jgi:hypothetical protein
MRTDDLVAMLAQGAGAVDRGLAARRVLIALGVALLPTLVLMQFLYGVRPTLAQDATRWMFWAKLAFVAAIALAGWAATLRLGRPGAVLARLRWLLIAPLAAMWLLAVIELLRAADGGRGALVLGQTWRECPFRIAILSLPAFAGLFWAMRECAPTRLRLAGAAAGLCAGGVGAVAYTFHCPELAASFLGVWYVIGMLIPAAAGALLGPRLLRW